MIPAISFHNPLHCGVYSAERPRVFHKKHSGAEKADSESESHNARTRRSAEGNENSCRES